MSAGARDRGNFAPASRPTGKPIAGGSRAGREREREREREEGFHNGGTPTMESFGYCRIGAALF